jgi:hypothetical protein
VPSGLQEKAPLRAGLKVLQGSFRINDSSKRVSVLWPFHGRGVGTGSSSLNRVGDRESRGSSRQRRSGVANCHGSERSTCLCRAPEPRRCTQRPRRGFALSVATLVTFVERKNSPDARPGLSLRLPCHATEGALPQESNSGRAESFRGIRPYGVRLKGKAQAS